MKKKEPLFEEMEFNDAAYAKTVLAEADKKLKRNTIAIGCAIAATVLDFTLVLWLSEKFFGDDLLTGCIIFWAIFAGVAFAIGGGFTRALKMVWKIAEFTWFIIPTFPIDLIFGISGFIVAGIMALLFPVVFVLANRVQLSKDKKAAEQYLSCFNVKPVVETIDASEAM